MFVIYNTENENKVVKFIFATRHEAQKFAYNMWENGTLAIHIEECGEVKPFEVFWLARDNEQHRHEYFHNELEARAFFNEMLKNPDIWYYAYLYEHRYNHSYTLGAIA